MAYVFNSRRPDAAALDRSIVDIFPAQACDAAVASISSWEGYAATPLHRLDRLASELRLGGIAVKDESSRFGLKSFKALGGAYAVERLALGSPSPLTVVAATDGNHGRSVAWGARRVGAKAKIVVHPAVSAARRQAMAAFGAEIREVPGSYDDAVHAAREMARLNGWRLVADTAADADDPLPLLVMQGYTIIAREVAAQWQGAAPTHVFVQVGVGGLAAAIAAEARRIWGDAVSRFVAVEPAAADCLFQSVSAGAPCPASGDLDTVMAGLSCGEVSVPAWRILQGAVTDAITISDTEAVAAMRRLFRPVAGDPGIEAGESGGVGLGGLMHGCRDPGLRAKLGLDAGSRVLLVNSEGATDPALFRKLVEGETLEPAP